MKPEIKLALGQASDLVTRALHIVENLNCLEPVLDVNNKYSQELEFAIQRAFVGLLDLKIKLKPIEDEEQSF